MSGARATARRSRRSGVLRILITAAVTMAALLVGLFMLVAGVAGERR